MSLAGMVLLNVKVDNIVCLDDAHQVLPLFGGAEPAKLMLTVNAVESDAVRADAEERMQQELVRATRERLGIASDAAVFYVSARAILACGVAQSLMGAGSFEELRVLATPPAQAERPARKLSELCALIRDHLGLDGSLSYPQVVAEGVTGTGATAAEGASLIERARQVVTELGEDPGGTGPERAMLPTLDTLQGSRRDDLERLYTCGLFGGAPPHAQHAPPFTHTCGPHSRTHVHAHAAPSPCACPTRLLESFSRIARVARRLWRVERRRD
jgi:hypothetical protein